MSRSLGCPNTSNSDSRASSIHSIVTVSSPLLYSSLSCFNYEIRRKDLDSAIRELKQYSYNIIAVWLVSRPINIGNFQHWAIKIHATAALIDIDFFEADGYGSFGIDGRAASWGEIELFMKYRVINVKTGQETQHSWEVLSAVIPKTKTPMKNSNKYSKTWGLELLQKQKIENLNVHPFKYNNVRDLATFLKTWYKEQRVYNSISSNCQKFALELFKFLVGEDHEDIPKITAKLQSPFDISKQKSSESRSLLKNPHSISSTNDSDFNNGNQDSSIDSHQGINSNKEDGSVDKEKDDSNSNLDNNNSNNNNNNNNNNSNNNNNNNNNNDDDDDDDDDDNDSDDNDSDESDDNGNNKNKKRNN